MLRIETKSRARALQILYAWELQGAPPIASVASGLARLTGPEPRILNRAEALAADIVADVTDLDAQAARAFSASASTSSGGERCRPRWPSTRPFTWPTGSGTSALPDS